VENKEDFLSVLSEQSIENLLTPQEVLKIQGKMWNILSGRAESYTRGGSSSLRVETAQKLLKSAGFVIRHGMNAVDGYNGFDGDAAPETVKARLLGEDYDTLFKAGLTAIEMLVKEGETLLETAVSTATAVENRAYHDTIKELGVFFKRYHYHHFAHDIPCVIDYPLAQPVDEALLGIDYINEYLRRLLIENTFCSRFEAESIGLLLRSISPDYKETLLNLYESVAANAIALTLCKGVVYALDITQNDREKLITLFRSKQEKRWALELQAASSALCSTLDITDRESIDYLTKTISDIQPRLQQSIKTKRLDIVFPSLYRESKVKKPVVTYVDGALMDAEKLRVLIDEISTCRYVSDKIILVKQNVHSLRDYFEILNICFWDEECIALFDSLSDEELRQLRLAIKQKQSKSPEWTSETGWENYLIDYIKGQ
jgi:hypothetical protein